MQKAVQLTTFCVKSKEKHQCSFFFFKKARVYWATTYLFERNNFKYFTKREGEIKGERKREEERERVG